MRPSDPQPEGGLTGEPAGLRADDPRGHPAADLIEVGHYPTGPEGFAHSLVVLAMGRACWLVPSPQGHRLLVEPDAGEGAREQLACFDRESVGWPPRPPEAGPRRATDVITPLMWALTVLVVFFVQARHPPAWTDRGVLDAQAVFGQGQWWRVGTALFLHADGGHVVSNALSGLMVFIAVIKTLGRVRGWLLVAAAALAGNLAIAALHFPAPYRSLGASTAIFAGVGLLTGRAVRLVARSVAPRRWWPLFPPLASGLVVLALYGMGGIDETVDIGAHLTGFAAGLGLGLLAAEEPSAPEEAVSARTVRSPHIE